MSDPRTPGMSSVPQAAPVHTDSISGSRDGPRGLARCQKLLEGGGHREICVHGLGLAINRAINIALQLQASSQGVLQLAANTSTVELVDDLEPEDPDEAGEHLTRTRNNSAIHIKVFYPDPQ
ncbi:Ribonuclease P protein subunit p20 [Dissostichus eleginoides]|uniref:Ribonuclease P protein subunit p20 n=1 Tax=Dissostichus eleginoides TaxID=100907 RepID=A0AAD9F6F2_DISEL|nr:Ribonuclease P protein subunit p20 [Dissostichus eleginoides]